MEPLSMTPARRLQAHRAYGDAFGTVAWRAPSARRFESRPANDFNWQAAPERAQASDMPRWIVILAGAVIAAMVGALLGGILAI